MRSHPKKWHLLMPDTAPRGGLLLYKLKLFLYPLQCSRSLAFKIRINSGYRVGELLWGLKMLLYMLDAYYSYNNDIIPLVLARSQSYSLNQTFRPSLCLTSKVLSVRYQTQRTGGTVAACVWIIIHDPVPFWTFDLEVLYHLESSDIENSIYEKKQNVTGVPAPTR